MPLTVSQALHHLPILSTARVVAGSSGLQHSIRWTHIVDNPEVVDWVREGILLVTTAYALKDDPDFQAELIRSMAKKKLAGMLVSIGKYIQEIRPEMIAAADEVGFPILTLPWEVALVDVTQAIHEQIVKEQYELIEQSQNIHRLLTQIVIEGGGLDVLAERLAHILNRSVSIEDPSLVVLASASVETIDDLRQKSIQTGRTPPEMVAYFMQTGVFEQLRRDPKPLRIAPVPELGMRSERIVASILIGAHLFGYIWIMAEGGQLAELDYLAIERAANIAALIISRQQAVDDAGQRAKSSLFESLMDPYNPKSEHTLGEILNSFGLHGSYQIILLDEIPASTTNIRRINRFVEDRLNQHHIQAAVIEWSQHIVVLFASSDAKLCKEVADDLVITARASGFTLSAGLSAPSTQPARARETYQEALNALRVGKALSKTGGCWVYPELGFWNYLNELPGELREKDPYFQIVKKIDQYDRDNATHLLATLEIYLDHSQSLVQAANHLYIHRNTLCQRLERIQKLWGLDLDTPNSRLSILLAIKNLRLNPEE